MDNRSGGALRNADCRSRAKGTEPPLRPRAGGLPSSGSFFAGRTPPPCTPIVLRCSRKGKRSIPKKSGSKNNGAFLCKIPMDIRRIFWQNNALRAVLHSPPPFF